MPIALGDSTRWIVIDDADGQRDAASGPRSPVPALEFVDDRLARWTPVARRLGRTIRRVVFEAASQHAEAMGTDPALFVTSLSHGPALPRRARIRSSQTAWGTRPAGLACGRLGELRPDPAASSRSWRVAMATRGHT